MPSKEKEKDDVIVIGAGAAGMTAAIALGQAGFAVTILEARDRIGGRVYTLREPSLDAPIELGAEFIHGKPPEIWKLFKKNKVSIREVEGDNWCVSKGELSRCDFFSQVDNILEQMSAHSPDQSFHDFLRRLPRKLKGETVTEEAKRRALAYVSGFNAADPALVSVNWLVQEMRAEEKTDGDRAFRSENGYEDFLSILRKQLAAAHVAIRTETLVEQVRWGSGSAEIKARSPLGSVVFSAPRVLVTLPLAVLKSKPDGAGAVEFLPALPETKCEAMGMLEMGKVTRVVLRFRDRIWKDISPQKSRTLSGMSFLFSDDKWFPTWWTTMPEKLPVITGWAPFRSAERLSGQSHGFVIDKSLVTLSSLLKIPRQELQQSLLTAHFHDWQSDPFSRGAYSYGKVGSDGAPEELGRPLKNTLFFAGEATDVSGNTGTVQAAIASGRRAAREILKTLKR